MRTLRCAERTLTFEHPQIMGVLNITPDSFSDGGRWLQDDVVALDQVVSQAQAMVTQGAAVLDIGGESTRPGATPVPIKTEVARVVPVVEALVGIDAVISVDTRHAEVAASAIAAGAQLINDVSAGADPSMLSLLAESDVGYALMHMQGLPATMQQAPRYEDVLSEIRTYLSARVDACLAAGIEANRLAIDPGFGFGKTLDHNLALLRGLGTLRIHDLPILVGLSRKSMLGAITDRPTGERVPASISAALLAAQQGADLIRVHDVAETHDALRVLNAFECAIQE